MRWVLPILVLLSQAATAAAGEASYAAAIGPTPVLNTPRIESVFGGADGRSLKTDRCGQVRDLEYIALPGTPFRIVEQRRQGGAIVYRVTTDEYPAPPGVSLYVDSRFVELRSEPPLPRPRRLPGRDEIVAQLLAGRGSPYVWGGNVRQGLPELLGIYYRGPIGPDQTARLTLAGLDCSGLLYQATGGWTPRNTSALVSYGSAVPVAGRTAEEIARLLQPLDLIVWNGHVVIVLDRERVIESRLECGKAGQGGVVVTPLKQRLAQVMRGRRPADEWPTGSRRQDLFVVRRWFMP